MTETARLWAEYICCEMDEMEFINESEDFTIKDPESDTTLDVTISCYDEVPVYCDQIKVVRGEVEAEPIRKSVNELLNIINQN